MPQKLYSREAKSWQGTDAIWESEFAQLGTDNKDCEVHEAAEKWLITYNEKTKTVKVQFHLDSKKKIYCPTKKASVEALCSSLDGLFFSKSNLEQVVFAGDLNVDNLKVCEDGKMETLKFVDDLANKGYYIDISESQAKLEIPYTSKRARSKNPAENQQTNKTEEVLTNTLFVAVARRSRLSAPDKEVYLTLVNNTLSMKAQSNGKNVIEYQPLSDNGSDSMEAAFDHVPTSLTYDIPGGKEEVYLFNVLENRRDNTAIQWKDRKGPVNDDPRRLAWRGEKNALQGAFEENLKGLTVETYSQSAVEAHIADFISEIEKNPCYLTLASLQTDNKRVNQIAKLKSGLKSGLCTDNFGDFKLKLTTGDSGVDMSDDLISMFIRRELNGLFTAQDQGGYTVKNTDGGSFEQTSRSMDYQKLRCFMKKFKEGRAQEVSELWFAINEMYVMEKKGLPTHHPVFLDGLLELQEELSILAKVQKQKNSLYDELIAKDKQLEEKDMEIKIGMTTIVAGVVAAGLYWGSPIVATATVLLGSGAMWKKAGADSLAESLDWRK